MSIHVALYHKTQYTYDRPVGHGPHVVRLRPAPHCRTKILSYSLRISGGKHFLNWQQDPFSNWNGRLVLPDKMKEFSVAVEVRRRLRAEARAEQDSRGQHSDFRAPHACHSIANAQL